ncbi:RdgB/HAM1 family non-canonical purine NTP pyrophosphatase [bacterium]|nr:RdgB/HAM1 family non-canonical purine NTP pyrophosphatase [bacterium]
MGARLYVGTKNRDKLREIEEILSVTLRSPAALPLELASLPKDAPDVPESGASLEENAEKKALAYARAVSAPVIADDTGLFVDALSGAPGIRAGRYAGENATYEENRAKLLSALEGVPEEKRTARFRCVIALARPGKLLAIFEGEVAGRILECARGAGTFGYDPLFFLPELAKTLAELSPGEKNEVSHRARALAHAAPFLLDLLGENQSPRRQGAK